MTRTAAGLGVILDVVYNHVGPDGNYLKQFSESYFTDRYENEWGEAINYDGPESGPVREWVTTNAAYWATEFHLDGLRLDATQQIFDASPEHIVAALARRMREAAADARAQRDRDGGKRGAAAAAGAAPERRRLRRGRVMERRFPSQRRWPHHRPAAKLTSRTYRGRPQEFISRSSTAICIRASTITWQAKRRGAPAWGLRPAQFVTYIENHDQIANTGRGERLDRRTSPGRLRALTALLLLAPGTPMLFQGQEFAASSPFPVFRRSSRTSCAALVREGRMQFLSQFPQLGAAGDAGLPGRPRRPRHLRAMQARLQRAPDRTPVSTPCTTTCCACAAETPVFRAQRPGGVDGAVLADEAFVLRYFGERTATTGWCW